MRWTRGNVSCGGGHSACGPAARGRGRPVVSGRCQDDRVIGGDDRRPSGGGRRGHDRGVRAAHCLTPDRVRAAADALAATPSARLTEGVTPADLAAAEIYPTIVWERGEPLDEVTAHYEALVTYFRAAAREGDGVLLWIG
ncbi:MULTISPECIES: DUF1877 family protein [Streptomyces]|uniref:DUF1877 family protein n=1 Tax=Streptomyces thermodiastaticus TaxID=44061 RepID=A0ABU0KBD2_9ACTN|nr:hypothetical protein [Streptomyces thermodiastaticus]MXQ57823.1 DUF1877 family protein [Streptomyces sp. XHT-2]UVT11539.1 DUF1877 family protein [Streptomyces thermocarboxydus]WSB43289.1 YfbM family protein [Streptomyces cellulosae]WTF22293.1 YfbM family protein [Streptomyces cellulosae]